MSVAIHRLLRKIQPDMESSVPATTDIVVHNTHHDKAWVKSVILKPPT